VSQNARILVIDDSKVIRVLVKTELEAKGYVVDTAEDGMSGLQKATSSPFDVVVIDGMMPGISGFDVCRKLAETRMDGRPMLVMLSNRFKDFQARQQAAAAGADAFVEKTVDAHLLVRKVAELLG
jgi:DNA-binding response OmpR family regulator